MGTPARLEDKRCCLPETGLFPLTLLNSLGARCPKNDGKDRIGELETAR